MEYNRSEAQLSILIQVVKEAFLEMLDEEKQQALDEAAEALKTEIQLYLTCDDPAQIQRARVTMVFLIPWVMKTSNFESNFIF